MWLALEVATGIVLAYVVIVKQAVIFKLVKWMLGISAVIVSAVLMWWGASEVIARVSPHMKRTLSGLGMVLFIIPVFGCAFVGGAGALLLFRDAFGKFPAKAGSIVIYLFAIGNVLFVWLVSWPVLSFTILGDWFDGIDQWSRGKGFADGGAIIVTSFFWLWPLLPLWLIARRRHVSFANHVFAGSQNDEVGIG